MKYFELNQNKNLLIIIDNEKYDIIRLMLYLIYLFMNYNNKIIEKRMNNKLFIKNK